MMQTIAPPRLAAWLVELFASPGQAEALLGDLTEEFAGIASHEGAAAARRWYRRQSVTTIAHLLIGQARLAPWSTAAFATLGMLLFNFMFWGVRAYAAMVVTHYRVYDHVSAIAFWQGVTLAQRYATPLLVGLAIAAAARGREMLAATAVCSTGVLWTVVALPIAALRASAAQQRQLTWTVFPVILANTVVVVALMLAGAVIVRALRPRTAVSLRA